MTRRVFLHIGLPKTATTFLQNVIWDHKEALKESGVLVPGRHRRRHLLATLDIREDPNLHRRPGDVHKPWDRLVEEIEGWDRDALISHEFFAAAAVSGIQRIRESFPDREVHVIITCRAMVDLGISRWQEWVKNGSSSGIDAYPPASLAPTDEWGWESFDLADILKRWGAEIPGDRIHILPMSTRHNDAAEIWRRFASVIGVDPDRFLAQAEPANASLGLVELEVLRLVNGAFADIAGNDPRLPRLSATFRGEWIRGYLAEGTVMTKRREKARPGPEKLAELTARGEAALALVGSGQFHVVGDIALLSPTDVSQRRHPSEVEPAELLDAAASAIAQLTLEVRELTGRATAPPAASKSSSLRRIAPSWRRTTP